MPRVRKGAARTQKHKKVLKAARGYIGAGSRRYRAAKEAVLRAGQYATIGRKLKKRDFRRLWITRISAACRMRGLTYSRFINALATCGIKINRKSLADIAVSDPAAFDKIVAIATAGPVAQKAPEKAKAAPAEKKPAAEKKTDEKPAVKKTTPEKAEAKPAAKKTTTKKAVKKATVKKTTTAKKTTTKKTVKKKAATKKSATTKTTSKKSTTAKKDK